MKETPQEHASRALIIWQLQRAAGIKAEDRLLPSPRNDQDAFEADLEIIRKCMERT